MAGDCRTALREARELSGILDPTISSQIAWVQAVNAAPYLRRARSSRDRRKILAMKAPDARLPYPTAMRHYARAVAYAQQRDRLGFDTRAAGDCAAFAKARR